MFTWRLTKHTNIAIINRRLKVGTRRSIGWEWVENMLGLSRRRLISLFECSRWQSNNYSLELGNIEESRWKNKNQRVVGWQNRQGACAQFANVPQTRLIWKHNSIWYLTLGKKGQKRWKITYNRENLEGNDKKMELEMEEEREKKQRRGKELLVIGDRSWKKEEEKQNDQSMKRSGVNDRWDANGHG